MSTTGHESETINVGGLKAAMQKFKTDKVDVKVDKVTGKGLSTNDYTTDEKNKLAGIAAGANVNVQSDWNATSGDAFIKNKPTITDTKNTTGTTNKTGTKMFLAAATEQSANPVTYSNRSCYIGTDNCLYSGGAKVLTAHDGNNRKAFYGTCTTAADTKDKVVTLAESAGWPGLVAGVIVGVKFSNTNTYASATDSPITLNVNSTGAKNIWFGATHSGAGNTGSNTTAYGRANYVNYYMYDGTYWAWMSSSADDNTTYSPLSLGFCYGTCSTAADTAAKTVTMGSYKRVAHGIVSIRFTNAITVANATLDINSKGAKAIYYKGAALGANIVGAGSTVVMQYDDSRYQIINIEAPIITTSEIDELLGSN